MRNGCFSICSHRTKFRPTTEVHVGRIFLLYSTAKTEDKADHRGPCKVRKIHSHPIVFIIFLSFVFPGCFLRKEKLKKRTSNRHHFDCANITPAAIAAVAERAETEEALEVVVGAAAYALHSLSQAVLAFTFAVFSVYLHKDMFCTR